MYRWYYIASAFFIMQTMGGFTFVDRHFYGEAGGSDTISQSLNLVTILIDLALFWRGFRHLGRIGTGGILALALTVFLCLSSVWSIDPQVTARRGILYLFFVIGSIGVASNLDGEEFMDVLRGICFVSAIGSVILLYVYPYNAWMPQHDAWRGLFAHKNTLGEMMATGTLASLHGIRVGAKRRLFGIATLMACIYVAYYARSSTALLTIFVFCATDGLLILLRRGGISRILGISLIVILTPIAAVAAVSPDSLLEMIGKDPTLTGRTDVWAYVMYYISERPMLGWGLYAFWASANPLAETIWTEVGWTVPHAHNGLLEMLLEVGIVGTTFFVSLFARNVAMALRALRTPAKELAISSLFCYGGIVLVGVSEVALVDPSQSSVTVFFVTGLICERAVRARRRRPVPAAPVRRPGQAVNFGA